MILEGPLWAQLLKIIGGVVIVAGFFSFVYKQKRGYWPWQKR